MQSGKLIRKDNQFMRSDFRLEKKEQQCLISDWWCHQQELPRCLLTVHVRCGYIKEVSKLLLPFPLNF